MSSLQPSVIDPYGLVAHALWILGAAVILAVSSFAHWLRQSAHGRDRRRQVAGPVYQLPLWCGFCLVTLGITLMPTLSSWIRILTATLLVAAVTQTWRAARPNKPLI